MHMVIEGNYGPVRPDPKTRGRGMVIVSNSYYTHQQENYRGLPKHFFYKCTLSGKQFQIKLSETSEKVILFYMQDKPAWVWSTSQIRCFYRKLTMATYKSSIFLIQTTDGKSHFVTHNYKEIKSKGCITKPLVPVDKTLI